MNYNKTYTHSLTKCGIIINSNKHLTHFITISAI